MSQRVAMSSPTDISHFGGLGSSDARWETGIPATIHNREHISADWGVQMQDDGKPEFPLEFVIENKEASEENNRMCREFLNFLLSAKQLVGSLELDYSPFFGSIESCKVLGEVVRNSETLWNLSLHGCGLTGDGLEYIIMGLLSNPDTVLTRLEIGSNLKLGTKGAELVEQLLLRNIPTLEILGIWQPGFSPEETAPVAKALAKNTTLFELSCGVGYTHENREGPLSYILKALTPVERLTPKQASYQDKTYNKTLRILSINYEYEMEIAANLMKMLTGNSSLKFLGLRFFQFDREQWRSVWDALKNNNILKRMDLYRCGSGLGDAFTDLMDLLQANRTLKSIELGETPLERTGQSAQVQQQLERNKRLADYLKTLNKSLRFVAPKIGRLFLCGFPKAGKTTLRRSMVATERDLLNRVLYSAKASMSRRCWVVATYYDTRTQGIEIRLLKTSEDKHIVVWDMAGQDEYHALHDSHYMFPDINQACMFLFLYKPVFDKSGRWREEDSIDNLESELGYWLSFINSNSRKTGWVLPQLTVVLTHLDILSLRFGMDEEKRAQNYVHWANTKVDRLRKVFKGRVGLTEKVHAIDAFSIQHAHGVVDDVYGHFDGLFKSTLPKIPAACEEMNLVLGRWTNTHRSCPIIREEEFFDLCKKNVRELDRLFQEIPEELVNEATDIREKHIGKNQLAVASYLHDVGAIIYFPKSNFVVVDPDWLGKVFLGQLFKPGDGTHERIIGASKNGCVSHEALLAVLGDFIEMRKYRGFTRGDLIELMKEMKLCSEEKSLGNDSDPARLYFIPSILSDPGDASTGRRKLEWTTPNRTGSNHSGVRLQCTDQSQTFLSPGLFQRFQVHLQTFSRNRWPGIEYEMEKNLIRLIQRHNGIELLVEKSGDQSFLDGDFVDILALSEGHDVLKSVVNELIVFCASREGCPGVALQEAFIRPGCVRKLTLCCHRKYQAVVKETLSQEVLKSLFESDQLEVWQDGGYVNSVVAVSQIYKHFFPAVPGDTDLSGEKIDAMRMLNFTDVKEAIFRYRTTISEKRYVIIQAFDDVQRVTRAEVSSPQTPSTSNEDVPDGPKAWIHFTDEIEKRNQDPFNRRLRYRETNGTIPSQLEEPSLLLQHIKDSMEDMQMLHQRMYSALIEKLDQVMGLTAELQDMPGMPYFSDKNMGWAQRLVASVQMGTLLKLQFMCENPSGPHYIKDQEGWPLINLLTGDEYRKLRPLMLGSLKTLFILIKARLHATAGLGDVIDEITSIPGAAPLIPKSLTEESIMDNISKFMSCDEIDSTLADARAWIQKVMEPVKASGKIATTFQLYQVKFKSKKLSTYVKNRNCFWLCEKCRNQKERANVLSEVKLPWMNRVSRKTTMDLISVKFQ